jgi:membrane-associated phospholipid phosphatase
VVNFLNQGVEVILWLQQFSPTLDLLFKSITYLGDETFYLLFMPLVYWCFDRRRGARLFILLLLSAYLNAIAKLMADQPRPFTFDKRVRAMVAAGGGGLPSGHTQNAVVVWGYLAAQARRKAWWLAAGFLMVAIPVSRLYLGVHFPTDLIGGYLLGAVILILFLRLAPGFETWLGQHGSGTQILISLAGPILLMLLNWGKDPAVLASASVLMGVCTGFALERRYVGFSSKGAWWKKALRYLLGVVVLFGLWGGLKIVSAGLEPAFLLRIVRYALVGLWGGLGAPWVFVRLKLADTE